MLQLESVGSIMDDDSTAVDTTTVQHTTDNRKQLDGTNDTATAQTVIADTDQQSEKCDRSPEIHEKSSCDLTPSDHSAASASNLNTITSTTETISSTTLNDNNTTSQSNNCDSSSGEVDRRGKSAGFSFTIDFNDGKAVDNRKYKEIAERLQNRQQLQQEQRRHRRGVSLSKLDDTRKSTTSLNNVDVVRSHALDDSSVSSTTTMPTATIGTAATVSSTILAKPPFKHRQGKAVDDAPSKLDENPDSQTAKVVLRRPRPTSQSAQLCKDQSKRHSWSPRSSMNYDKLTQQQIASEYIEADDSTAKRSDAQNGQYQPKSTILQRVMECQTNRTNKLANTNSGKSKRLTSDANFVVTTPLEFVRASDDEGSMEMVSEAGTYTLDGDNYTEEEKERMSIDKLSRKQFDLSIESKQSMHDLNKNYAIGMRQALNVNYPKCDTKMVTKQRHSMDNDLNCAQKPGKISYLDKIKGRVRNIGDRTFHKSAQKSTTPPPSSVSDKLKNLKIVRTDGDDSTGPDIDHGVFTSITACGVLKKHKYITSSSAAAANHRKSSLSKLHIDSSEYIQPKVDEKLMSCYTDYEKVNKQNEYKLKIFSAVSPYTSSTTTSPQHTDDDNLSIECVDEKPISIKTAPTKNDWIQEWAKNARRHNHSLGNSASASPKLQHQTKTNRAKQQSKGENRMSQSYDVAYFNDGEQFGDDVNGGVDSDECAAHLMNHHATANGARKMDEMELKNTQAANLHRPPISPTKIPSPMHAQLRARSSSANRSFRSSNLVSVSNGLAI